MIQRYKILPLDSHDLSVIGSSDGDWVKYSDVEEIEKLKSDCYETNRKAQTMLEQGNKLVGYIFEDGDTYRTCAYGSVRNGISQKEWEGLTSPNKPSYLELEKRVKELEEANKILIKSLKPYADRDEWYKSDYKSHWDLLFNSSNRDGHGWELADKALKMVVNKCDTCQNCFGSCNSKPKFGIGRGFDNVIECDKWMPLPAKGGEDD